MADFTNHPCFDPQARHTHARIHLPVAPRCNVQCHYCNRQNDCVNESRPGVTSSVLTPEQALSYLNDMVAKLPQTSVVGIAGPGDPMANPDETLKTLHLVRDHYPDMLLCLATNGLNLLPYLDELAELKVSHVTLTINAVNPEVSAGVYAWMRYDKRSHTGLEAATHLWETQKKCIAGLKERGITVKVNSLCIPGFNENHLKEIARTVADLGADLFNIIPLYPVAGTVFGYLEEPSQETLKKVRAEAGIFLKQMTHCQRCRADAAGILGQDHPETAQTLAKASGTPVPTITVKAPEPEAKAECSPSGCSSCASGCSSSANISPEQREALAQRWKAEADEEEEEVPSTPTIKIKPRIRAAVASMEGVLVSLHLGQAQEFMVYEKRGEDWKYVESRRAPEAGGGDDRWKKLGELLSDCGAVFVSGAGAKPQEFLGAMGVEVYTVEGLIDELLETWASGKNLGVHLKTEAHSCASGCRGTGGLC